MCLFYFGGFPRNPVYRPIVCQLSVGERVKSNWNMQTWMVTGLIATGYLGQQFYGIVASEKVFKFGG